MRETTPRKAFRTTKASGQKYYDRDVLTDAKRCGHPTLSGQTCGFFVHLEDIHCALHGGPERRVQWAPRSPGTKCESTSYYLDLEPGRPVFTATKFIGLPCKEPSVPSNIFGYKNCKKHLTNAQLLVLWSPSATFPLPIMHCGRRRLKSKDYPVTTVDTKERGEYCNKLAHTRYGSLVCGRHYRKSISYRDDPDRLGDSFILVAAQAFMVAKKAGVPYPKRQELSDVPGFSQRRFASVLSIYRKKDILDARVKDGIYP